MLDIVPAATQSVPCKFGPVPPSVSTGFVRDASRERSQKPYCRGIGERPGNAGIESPGRRANLFMAMCIQSLIEKAHFWKSSKAQVDLDSYERLIAESVGTFE